MRHILRYLQLDQVGLLELLFAFYCILSGYGWGVVRGNVFFMLLMIIIAYRRSTIREVNFKPLQWLLGYVIIHELFLMYWINAPVYLLNKLISDVVITFGIIPIVQRLDFKKMICCINWVAIMSMIGILYHYLIIRHGGLISPIPIPFFPDMESGSRLFSEMNRPCSFFWEPAAFVTFMMVPLYISLDQKRYIWTCLIVISMFLSTSSTGILMSIVMLTMYVFRHNVETKYKVLLFFLGSGLVCFLLFSDLFTAGIDKINDTDIETTSRLINGPSMVFNMPLSDIITGMPASNAYDYYINEGFKSNNIIVKHDSIFVSTFWIMLAKYGVFGIMLFLIVYLNIARSCRELFPYLVVLFISFFFQGFPVGSYVFSYQLIFMYVYTNSNYRLIQI